MAKNSRPSRLSRLSPVYLLRRHAGTVFLFLALGLLAGVAQRVLVQPARYSAAADAQARIVPEELADAFDWQAKQRDWDGLLSDRQELGLLGSNLRHALKLAVTAAGAPGVLGAVGAADALDAPGVLDAGNFSDVFSRFGAGESYSALLFRNPYLARLGPSAVVSREELAGNLDFQSLAAIIADCAPLPGAEGWDFSFYSDFRPASAADDALTAVDALPGVVTGNPAFRVLFALHRMLRGAEAGSLADAWKTAADELAARLAREASFAGGGGFGGRAKAELLREIAALPALVANNLYTAESWYRGEGEPPSVRWADAAAIDLSRRTPAAGTVRVSFASDLNPVVFPRDTVLTRVQPLAAATLLATLAARESRRAERMVAPAPAAPAPVVAAAPAPQAEAAPEPEIVEVTPQPAAYREEVDAEANAARLARIDGLEESLRLAVRDREACLRRLSVAREDETRLSVEAMNARERADRLSERYDSATVLAEGARAPEISKETKKLLLLRDKISRRVHELLAYCTEEHPFVIAARRELEAVEAALGGHVNAKLDPDADGAANAHATRLSNIYVELEAATATAGDLEERRARQAGAVASLAEELNNIEAAIRRNETDLDAARRAPVPMRRVEIAPEPVAAPEAPAPAAVPEVPAPSPSPAPVAVPAPAPAPLPEKEAPRLAFGALPGAVPLQVSARDWNVPAALAVCGFALGILISIVRELLSSRFANPAEARRMVGLPVLATLPAYDAKSFRRAAATVKGEVTGKAAGALQFVPAPVELFEPPTEARRGRVLRVKRRPRALAWVCGLVLILAAAFLYHFSPGAGSPPPAVAVPVWRSTP